jgi:hypothetical protein
MSDGRRTAQPYVRKRKWIRPDIQLKVVLRTMFVAILGLLINFQLSLIGYWLLVQQGPASDPVGRIPGMLLKYFLISLGIAVPLSITVAVIFSFKFCGPIFRLSRYLGDLVEGSWDRRCGLRAGDDLQDLKDTLNAALDVFRDCVRGQHHLLHDAGALLRASKASSSNPEAVEELLARIEAEGVEYDRRLGGGPDRAPTTALTGSAGDEEPPVERREAPQSSKRKLTTA